MYPTTTLQPGQSGNEVKKLQEFLLSQEMNIPAGPTGYFGDETKAALTQWQKQTGVQAGSDFGYWGPKSRVVAKRIMNPDDDTPDEVPDEVPNAFEDYNKAGDTPTSSYGQNGSRNEKKEEEQLRKVKIVGAAAEQERLISPEFLKEIFADSSIIGFYINALAYGGYSPGDILNDMSRRELISQGKTPEATSLKLIDPETIKEEYQKTTEGKKSYSLSSSLIPTFSFAGFANSKFDYEKSLDYQPTEAFDKARGFLEDRNSQEYKDAIENVKTGFFDTANTRLQANTEQEKAIADYNYNQFKKQIEEQYGIALSDDATKAWAQILELENTTSNRGISGSGMEAEGIDKVLQAARKEDQRLRQSRLSQEEAKKAAYYTSSASEEEIAGLTPKEREDWGLAPSADILAQSSIETLRAQNPDLSDEEIQSLRDSVVDKNGNYRSKIFANKFEKLAENKRNKRIAAEELILEEAKRKDKIAGRQYDNTETPYSGITEEDEKYFEEIKKKDGDKQTPVDESEIPVDDPSDIPPGTPPKIPAKSNQNRLSPSNISATLAQTRAMLAQTKKQGSKPFAGSSYDKNYYKKETPVTKNLTQIKTPISPTYSTTYLQPGSTGSEVKKLQDYLVSNKYMTQGQVNTGYGIYGNKTRAAVTALQKKLKVDNSTGAGYYGPKTITALKSGKY